MSKSVDTTLTVINETDLRARAILNLISTYIPGLTGRYYGFRSLGSNDLSFPCVMVEPDSQNPAMLTTGKYHLRFNFSIFWFVYDNNAADVVTLATSVGEALVKLFSNDALGDLQTSNPPTNRFKQYSGFWLTSEMTSVEISRTILNAYPNRAKYMRAGIMRLMVEDVVIK